MAYWIAAVDDDSIHRKTAERILTANGYKVTGSPSGEALLASLITEKPDLILLDLHMTGIDGFTTLEKLRMLPNGKDIPVIFMASKLDADTQAKLLGAGAADFVTKPFVPSVLLLRVKQTLELRRQQDDIRSEIDARATSSREVQERNKSLSLQLTTMLAGFVESSSLTGHGVRTAKYALMIAKEAACPAESLEGIVMAALLHDIGMAGVPEEILNKPAHLTEEEYAVVKKHTTDGAARLKSISAMPSLAEAALWHHEHYDGTGYPDGLAGTAIPEESRIIAVADAYDAMCSRRCYREPCTMEYIRGELKKGRGTQFDPRFTDILLGLIDKGKAVVVPEAVTSAPEPEPPKTVELPEDPMARLQTVGFDTTAGLKSCLGDKGFYTEMLRDFAEKAQGHEEKLTRAHDKRDWNAYNIYAHNLRSAARTIGANELAAKAECLETAAKQADTAYIAAHHRELLAHLQEMAGHARYAAEYKQK